MSTKNNPGQYDCYNAADPDEPTFTLRAKDPNAAPLVRQWAGMRLNAIMCGQKPNTPEQMAKISEALKCADEMQAWHFAHVAGPAHEAAMQQAKDRLNETLQSMGYEPGEVLPEAATDKPKPN